MGYLPCLHPLMTDYSLNTKLAVSVNYIDLWVPLALLGLIVMAAVYFASL